MIHRGPVGLVVGEIVSSGDGALVVRVDGAARAASRAVSCLVAPEVGDRAVIAAVGARWFVLHVLDAHAVTTLSLDRDVELRAGERLRIEAEHGVDLSSPSLVRVAAEELSIRASRARAGLAEGVLVARRYLAEVTRLELAGGDVDRIADRIIRRAKRVIRRVDGPEEVEAGEIDVVAARELTLESNDAAVSAETLVKADAKQVQVG
ncbi:MAG TPA: DUF3540 domain-containing protein [Byssovorax sp.]|jgi:hypothetical protein